MLSIEMALGAAICGVRRVVDEKANIQAKGSSVVARSKNDC